MTAGQPVATGTASGATEFAVTGMTCANCARHVSEAIQSVPAVASASIQLDRGRAMVRWKGNSADADAVMAAVAAAGYEARLVDSKEAGSTEAPTALEAWQTNVLLGVAFTAPLMLGEWVLGFGMQPWFQKLSFFQALVVQIFCGARFYQGAWRQLKQGSSNMDTLVALGSSTAFGYSAWALFAGAPGCYFMESAAIITLVSLGHWFEARTSAKAEGSLQALLHLAPEMARRRGADGAEVEVPARELQLNDVIVLRPGDRVPVDAVTTGGASSIDESMLTGESLPVDKKIGDRLFAGTVNLDGQLTARVSATGEQTALAHIIAAVARAQTSRAEIQRLGDRVSNVFVPIVVLIAVATALWWGLANPGARQLAESLSRFLWHSAVPGTAMAAAFIQAAAVLIIACPCAMGLATPVAIMAGTNSAARRGILIRDGIALERAGTINALVFDKTGTLTQGKPVVGGQLVFDEKAEPIKLAAALARRSNHPLSRAVATLADAEISLHDWQEIRGSGVQAKCMAGTARLGSLKWLGACGVLLESAKIVADNWAGEGSTVLGVAVENRLLAVIAVRDSLKPGAAEVVAHLRQDGLKVYLVTGDNEQTARAIGGEAGVIAENVMAETRPEQKAEFIRALQKRGERVAFVGDGINDAPALEAADLGIAVSSASDVAREAADIILLRSEISAVPEALGMARATLRTIKQNLFWAFFYNAAGIPLAALGFMSPVLCAAAMGLSDLVVIGNALRLLRWRHRN